MRFIWRWLSNIVRGFWRALCFIREFFLNILTLLVILVIVGIYLQIHSKPVETEKGALLVNLSGTVVDNPSLDNRLEKVSRELMGTNSNKLQENSLFDLIDSIQQAEKDPKISGMVLSLNDFVGADQPSLRYIGKALQAFRDSGKPIYAVGDSYNQSQYFLASYANKIYLSPMGIVDLHGLATNNLYYKSLLDKLKVSTHIFRVGTYKSAVEPIIRDDMSSAARDADSRWLNGMWDSYLDVVAKNRQVTPQQMFPGADNIISGLKEVGGDTANYALKHKQVDILASHAEVEKQLAKVFGWNKHKQNYQSISIYDYDVDTPKQTDQRIAVIFADGAIIDGESIPGSIGGDTVAKQIRKARLDNKVKAIILRVNSPGGSVSASELIRSELAATKAAGKPIVVSMGGLAASGGYWISTPADYIVADKTTLTGSIGIFGVINTFENSLKQIGVNTDGVSTSSLADLSISKKLPDSFSKMMQINIESGYQHFIDLVAKSRHKTPQEVDSIAQGRVWLGSDAKANGLVDKLGDFDDAVKKAGELAKLKNPSLDWITEDPSVGQMILGQLTSSAEAVLPDAVRAMIPQPLLHVAAMMKAQSDWMMTLNDPKNSYAICLSCDSVR